MVYLYRKKIGDRSYYYLRLSKRKGNRTVTKDVAYLGAGIDEVKKTLENLPKYREDIKKAYRTLNNFIESNRYLEKIKNSKIKSDKYLDYEDLLNIEACKLHFNSVFSKLDESTKKEIFKNFVIEFSFNTTSIEGNTITLKEARNLLAENLTPKNKSLREVYDVQNTEEAFFGIIGLKQDLSNELIEKIHQNLMKNIDSRTGYRIADVRVFRSAFKSTPAPYVKEDMNILLKWYDKNKKDIHPFVLAAAFHHKFEKIHPFMDGNGRTGRMLMNLILLRNNYPPLIVHKKKRQIYLKALSKADKSGLNRLEKENYSELLRFASEELKKTYWDMFL